MTKPSKARIRQSFEHAAPTYDSAAGVQRDICRQLAGMLPPAPLGRVLDAGCGTGYALRLLHAHDPAADIIALDFSPAMLCHVVTPARRLTGDLEHLPLAAASIDLYWSSLAVQWCDLSAVLAEARRVLAPGGRLLLATLGPATFRELRHAFAGIDGHQHTLGFHDADSVRALAASQFPAVDLQNSEKIAHYADFRSLLRAIKAVGANQLGDGRRRSLLSRTAFARAEAAMETLRTPAGLPLTYDVLTLSAR
jgi:malonyl-CoA O-methyltransferase